MSEKPVTNNDLEKLRKAGMISEQVVALIVGDVVLVVKVLTKHRRILDTSGLLLESTRRVMRD